MTALLLLICACILAIVDTRKCYIGYGQRGLSYANGIQWDRDCVETDYCYEVVTKHIEQVQNLIDYPWDPYYDQFYIKSCGGAQGMPAKDYHPWINIEGASESVLGSLRVNITFPKTITRHGGTEIMDLRYTCRKDYCSGAYATSSRNLGMVAAVTAVAAAAAALVRLGATVSLPHPPPTYSRLLSPPPTTSRSFRLLVSGVPLVDVCGASKGKGFQGVMERWQERRMTETLSHRVMGSTGNCQHPGRMFKDKNMPGRMGDRVTVACMGVGADRSGWGMPGVASSHPRGSRWWVMAPPAHLSVPSAAGLPAPRGAAAARRAGAGAVEATQ
eukprot:CAMPEP_0173367398 /NCGR_PEP_ID=MMETSP1144-20121109/24832_1 /TAXON_ID=483371 /ORGANISM="non described non described, Strain CCMP2298" /LENGTH=329 /DNA_ID=CAMNT_0014318281 /DNA_START=211 /DNA_END=1200 /DNA_ORIENTATION=-